MIGDWFKDNCRSVEVDGDGDMGEAVASETVSSASATSDIL